MGGGWGEQEREGERKTGRGRDREGKREGEREKVRGGGWGEAGEERERQNHFVYLANHSIHSTLEGCPRLVAVMG